MSDDGLRFLDFEHACFRHGWFTDPALMLKGSM
jgi:hypothetical protein